MDRILLFVLVICLVNIFIFLFMPNSSHYTFNLDSSLREPWRLFTFQLFHINIFHLLENVIGFIFIALIAIELEIDFKEFLFIYSLVTFIVILPILFVFPFDIVAGNSTGIYGVLALCLIKARKIVSLKITLPLVVISIFSLSILNFILYSTFMSFFKVDFFHFIGFLSGISLSLITKAKPKIFIKNVKSLYL